MYVYRKLVLIFSDIFSIFFLFFLVFFFVFLIVFDSRLLLNAKKILSLFGY